MTNRQKNIDARDALTYRIERQSAITPDNLRVRLIEEFPRQLAFLFEPHPYKIAWSGRYAQKSWSFAAAILALGMERPLRVVCLRETMKSLDESVHTLMEVQIKRLALLRYYRVLTSEIRGTNGTRIFYAGLRGASADAIKSMEGCDIFWVEEGQGVTKQSWLILDPTVRKPGAELWILMNPRFASDDSYLRWILNPPPRAVVVHLNYRDNKFVTPDMQEKIDLLRAQDPDEYQHVYEGVCKSTVQDAVYKAQIVEAEKRGRFCRVEYDPRKPVDTFWDLGYGDMVSVWFAQLFPLGETRLIDFYENTHQAIDHYVQVMQGKGYNYGECVFPWDGGARHVSTGKSTADLVRGKGYRVRVIRQGFVYDQINYLRTIFPLLYFDAERCAKGIEHLRNYQWGPPGPEGCVRREPLHDEHSHAARALDCMATAIKSPAASAPQRAIPERRQFGSFGSFR